MYQAFYGLASKPFQLNPDPLFYFGSTQHRRARAYLEYGVHRNEGFIVITGEIGAGKTTIVRGLLSSLDANQVVSAHLVTTQLDADDILRMVGAAFGVAFKSPSKADVLLGLEAWLTQQAMHGRRCLLVVDEAQNLTPRAVEELRMLSNFQYGQQALLQTFLVGQPEFRAILQSPQMEQLRQRVTATCHIGPLDAAETQGYITHRLHCAGSTGKPRLDDGVFQAIFQASGGIPRRINQVCDRLLLAGYLAGKDHFLAEDVQEVSSELHAEFSAPASKLLHSALQARTLNAPQGPSAPQSLGAPQVLGAQQSLSAEQIDTRLRRVEMGLLRLERLQLRVLQVLQGHTVPTEPQRTRP